jgi:starch-binding outer membrane protein, SusD/RagB family
MRTKFRLIYFVSALLSLTTSCANFLDLKPKDNLVQDEFWQNKEQVNSAVAACYASMNETGYMDRVIMWGELRAEMLVSARASGDQLDMLMGFMKPSSSVVDWASFYKTINYCNTVLAFGKTTLQKDPTFTETELKIYEGEALAVRALTYFILVRNFKDVPLVVTATLNDQTDFYVKKEKEGVIIAKIIDDLKIALNALPVGYAKSAAYDKGRMTKGAVLALLADVYLWSNRYNECIAACGTIEKLNKYHLVDGSDWFNKIFFAGNSEEGIFELQFNDIFATLRNYFYVTNPMFKAYNGIADLYGDDLNDKRGNLTTFNQNGNIVFKFAGVNPNSGEYRSDQQFYNTWVFYRYADVILMQAEAYLKSSTRQNLDSAYFLINSVHQRATSTPLEANISVTELEKALLLERQKEFAYEGKRWYDLLRFARRNKFQEQKLITEMAETKTNSDNFQEIMSYYSDTASYFLPIYMEEINKNPNLEQNPYYKY